LSLTQLVTQLVTGVKDMRAIRIIVLITPKDVTVAEVIRVIRVIRVSRVIGLVGVIKVRFRELSGLKIRLNEFLWLKTNQ
jgi:hypothetical protein